MNKLVVLSLGSGDLHNGFPAVTAQLWEAGDPHPMKFIGSLPAAPALPQLYRDWQLLYSALYQRLRPRIEIETSNVTNVSSVGFSELCQRLSNTINAWFNSEPFLNINRHLRTKLDPKEEIRFIIETNDNLLRRLPWHLWNFFEDYPLAEVALSASEYQRPKKSLPKKTQAKVKILAIFGNSKGIDIGKDKTFLEQLSDKAQTKFLGEPQLKELNDHLWEKQGWDILFFAGHSCSQEQGVLQLNQTDTLTLDQLRYALQKAIAQGLKLAIFNSCDGLGLAHDLADLHIGQVIVMREPVPDLVAQEFLRHFLAAFSSGESLYASVREARERLQGLERHFPCASWLPVICQNPAEAPTSWQELSAGIKRDSATGIAEQQNTQLLPSTRRFKTVLVASLVVTALVMGVRHLGMLQTWELQAYDQLMRLRPDEGPDSRLLVVGIKDEDLQVPEQKQRRKGTSLSDLALARLLEKLEAYQPRAIGLDIFRDFPADPKQVDLETRLQSNRFFAVCNVGEPGGKDRGISPPPDIPQERLGFSNVLPDSDGIVRRHLLSMDARPPSRCTASKALSFQLALRYLKAEGITDKVIKGNWQLGKVVFKRLQAPAGGYQKADTWGNQVLLNYRSYRSPLEIADIVTLTDVLTNEVRPEDVKDRIVLIGVMTRTSRDRFLTPYSAGQSPKQEMPGVILHAQMVSQILNAVLKGRPLLWVWPVWGEVLWVWGWSFVGGILTWRFRSPQALGLAVGVTLGILYGMSFSLIIQGGWVPLVPSALALVATGGSVLAKRRVSALPTSGFRPSDSS